MSDWIWVENYDKPEMADWIQVAGLAEVLSNLVKTGRSMMLQSNAHGC